MTIKSINYSQAEIIQNICSLHKIKNIDLDLTYSKGSMYKGSSIFPKIKLDISSMPYISAMSDARNIPLRKNSIESIMFDPPFLATTY